MELLDTRFSQLQTYSLYFFDQICMKCFNPCPACLDLFFSLENTEDPDQLASDKANRSGSTMFSTLIENTYD